MSQSQDAEGVTWSADHLVDSDIMKAIEIHGKKTLVWVDVPTPEPAEGQVRLRVRYVGICGSDLHYYLQGANGAFVIREPLIPGHELSGTIDFDPKGEFAPGTPVTVHPATFGEPTAGLEKSPQLWPNGAYLGSASTWPHTQGTMREFIVLERSMIRVLPETLPVRRAALAEPLAVAIHGIALSGGVKGKRVMVSGCGPMGLLSAAAAIADGASEVIATDILPIPLERARALGVSRTLNALSDEMPVDEIDVVLECAGAPSSINAGLRAAARGAIYVQVGMVADKPQGINLAPVISKEVTIHGSFRFANEIDKAIELLDSEPHIEQVITHEYSLEHAKEAFLTAADPQSSSKVLVSL